MVSGLGQGAVDFTVFTDRSRMHVYFIEVKGADFHFVNANGSIHANINEGARQVRERITEVSQNYQECTPPRPEKLGEAGTPLRE